MRCNGDICRWVVFSHSTIFTSPSHSSSKVTMAYPRNIVGPGRSTAMRVALSPNQLRTYSAFQCLLIGQPLWLGFVFHKSPRIAVCNVWPTASITGRLGRTIERILWVRACVPWPFDPAALATTIARSSSITYLIWTAHWPTQSSMHWEPKPAWASRRWTVSECVQSTRPAWWGRRSRRRHLWSEGTG